MCPDHRTALDVRPTLDWQDLRGQLIRWVPTRESHGAPWHWTGPWSIRDRNRPSCGLTHRGPARCFRCTCPQAPISWSGPGSISLMQAVTSLGHHSGAVSAEGASATTGICLGRGTAPQGDGEAGRSHQPGRSRRAPVEAGRPLDVALVTLGGIFAVQGHALAQPGLICPDALKVGHQVRQSCHPRCFVTVTRLAGS